MLFRSADLAHALGGTHHGPDISITSVSIDSRTCADGSLFVPVVYERDGHDYIRPALENGAVAYLSSRGPVAGTGSATFIEVPDTGAALLRIGSVARDRLPDRVVAVTGSVGKSTVKDLAGSVLSRRWRTLVSPGNYNNELGLPLALANADEGSEALMLEMGARGIGHIAQLCAVARPSVGIVTMVAAVHTEVFGSIDDVARGKAELVEALPAHGFAVLNADDARVAAMAQRTEAGVVTFGQRGDIRAEDVSVDDRQRAGFHLRSPWGGADVKLSVHGVHNVANALAAAGAGLVLGLGPEEVAAGLGEARLSHWRMEITTAPSGAVVINDAYNASPVSVDAALRTAAALPARRHIVVLGAMAELGPEGPDEHRRMGRLAADLGFHLLAVGTDLYGPTPTSDWEAALDAVGRLQPGLGEGDVVLVKGSRVLGLERLAVALTEVAEDH